VNRKLSDRRAQSVAAFLIDQGVSSTRVKARGLGATRPVTDNSTPMGRQKNRRVEIIVSGEFIDIPVVGSESNSN
jgi:OOP family OmpA-OmpF porin